MIEESPITDIAQIIQLAGAPMLLREVSLATAGLRFRRHLGHAGRMPFGLRFMVPTMSHAIAKDDDLGLAMLNGYLDPSASHPEMRRIRARSGTTTRS